MLTADILIPVYRPDGKFEELLKRLDAQRYPIRRVIVMNTEEKFFPKGITEQYGCVEVHHVTKSAFDHGGTRDQGIGLSDADVVICMTQDAVPKDRHLIGNLMKAFEDPGVWAAYARQLPAEGCSEVEAYTRSFNYPPESRLKGKEDLRTMGIKAFFCSNVCAAWRRDRYMELGGFEKRTIFNEDMILAGRFLQAGGMIAYCADARVIHSHNYSAVQQFHRYFDLAVSQAMHPEVFAGIRSESEGIRLVKKCVGHCIRVGKPWLIFSVAAQNAGKLLGYRLGKKYEKLPRKLILMCTMNRSFWQEEGR